MLSGVDPRARSWLCLLAATQPYFLACKEEITAICTYTKDCTENADTECVSLSSHIFSTDTSQIG